MLNTVDKIIGALGGPTSTAEIVGCTTAAVSNWLRRGSIPPELFFVLNDALPVGKEADRSAFAFKAARAKRRA